MNTKLTLRLDEDLIDRAKRYSSESGKSLSRLVADFFATIDTDDFAMVGITPRVHSLLGILSDSPLDEDDYRRHLEEKYR